MQPIAARRAHSCSTDVYGYALAPVRARLGQLDPQHAALVFGARLADFDVIGQKDGTFETAVGAFADVVAAFGALAADALFAANDQIPVDDLKVNILLFQSRGLQPYNDTGVIVEYLGREKPPSAAARRQLAAIGLL
jgi:hypothetical protein